MRWEVIYHLVPSGVVQDRHIWLVCCTNETDTALGSNGDTTPKRNVIKRIICSKDKISVHMISFSSDLLISSVYYYYDCSVKEINSEWLFRTPSIQNNCTIDKFFSSTHCLLLYYWKQKLDHQQIVHGIRRKITHHLVSSSVVQDHHI